MYSNKWKHNYRGREKWTNRVQRLAWKNWTKDLIKNEKILAEMFNKHYINIVEETSGIAPKNLGNSLDPKLDKTTILEIIENYRNHPQHH